MADGTVRDSNGRTLTLRKLTILDQARIFRAIGPAQASNEPYTNLVVMAACVVSIDGAPVPSLTAPNANERTIDAALAMVGDEGFAAVLADAQLRAAEMTEAALKAAAGGGKTDPLEPSAA